MAANSASRFVNNARDKLAKRIAEDANSAFPMAGLAQQSGVWPLRKKMRYTCNIVTKKYS
jgi:hypothetical protein